MVSPVSTYSVVDNATIQAVENPVCLPQEKREADNSRYLTLVSVITNALHRRLKPHPLNATEYRILVRLVTHQGCLNTSELSAMLSLTQSSIRLAYAQLVRLGAVTGKLSLSAPKDPCLSITPRGIEYVREIRELVAPVHYQTWNEVPTYLHAYTQECTLCVSEEYGLFPESFHSRPLDIALHEEMFATSTIVSQICSGDKISFLGQRILTSLKNEPEGMNPGVLAKELHVKPNSITAAGKHLQKMSLIRQTSDKTDRRASILEITSAGWDIHSRVDRRVAAFLETGLLPCMSQEDVAKHRIIADSILGSGVPAISS